MIVRYLGILVLSGLTLFSCSKPIGHPSERFEFLSGEVVQDAQVTFRFNLDDADKLYYNNQMLYAEIHGYPSADTERASYTVVKLSPGLEGRFIVPGNTAALEISLSTKERSLNNYSSGIIAVLNEDLQPVRKARAYLIWKGQQSREKENVREIVDSLFIYERRMYPDDLSIFAARWLYELKTGSLDTARIRKDLEIISDFRERVDGAAMFYLGSYLHFLSKKQKEAAGNGESDTRRRSPAMEMQQLSRQYPIPNTIVGKTDNPIFNDPIFVSLLLIVRGTSYLISSDWMDEIQRIMRANPLSLFSENQLLRGIFKDMQQEIALYVVEEMTKRYRYPLYKYYKMKILSASYPNRREECYSLVEELKAIIHKDTYYEEGLDPGHHFYRYRIEPYLVEGDLLAKEGKYDSAIAAVKKTVGMINDPWDISRAIAFSQCSEYFLKKGRIDSSTKYMVAAAQIAPGMKFIEDTLRVRYGREKTKLPFLSWIREIEKTIPALAHVAIPKAISLVQLQNGSALDFGKLGDTVVVIECWSAGCSFCTHNIKNAHDFMKSKHPAKIKILVASPDARELEERMRSLYIDLPVIAKGGDVIRAFGITSYPTTIVIRDGRIIRKYSGVMNINDVVDLVQ